MIEQIVQQAPYFLLIAVRIFAMILTSPLLSTNTVNRAVKVALAGYTAFLVMPTVSFEGWNIDPYNITYLLLVIGEGLIGVISGFYLSLLFATFSSAGQFFTYQMGFGASEVYDTLNQVENPLMGQFLNLIAMFLFLNINGFQLLFTTGVIKSFECINCFSLLNAQEEFLSFLLSGLTKLFLNAIMIALPITGTLFLISVGTGLLSKAAPQMNLLSEGLPITILCAFGLLVVLLDPMSNYFVNTIYTAFEQLVDLFLKVGRAI